MIHKNCPMCGKKAIETIFSFNDVGIICSNKKCGVRIPIPVAPWKFVPKRLRQVAGKNYKDFEAIIRLEAFVKAWKLWDKRVNETSKKL